MAETTFCIQCMLEAFVKGEIYQGDNESNAAHLQRVHPQGVDPARRRELEEQASARVKEMVEDGGRKVDSR